MQGAGREGCLEEGASRLRLRGAEPVDQGLGEDQTSSSSSWCIIQASTMCQAPHGPFYPTPDFSSRSDPGDTRTWGTSSQGMGRGRWTQDEQGVRAISINLREPIQPWCPQCPVTDSRGLRHGCPGLESWSFLCHQKSHTGGATSHNPPTGVWCVLLVSEHSQKCSPLGMARLPTPPRSLPLWGLQLICSPSVHQRSAETCRDQCLQPPSDSLFMNIPFLFRNAGPTSQGLHGAGRRVKPWVFGAMPGPEVTLNR